MKVSPLARVVAVSLAFFGGNAVSQESAGIESAPLAETGASPGEGTLFERLDPETTGVGLVIPIDDDHPLARAYHSSSACSGVAIGDFDLDGKPDIFAGNGPRDNALYLQRDTLKFENVAESAGVTGGEAAWAVGMSLADFDDDGDLDIYVCNYDYPNQLFVNQTIDGGKRTDGPLKFAERAAEFGLDLADGSVVPAFADYDRDGDLDVYILTHQIYRENGRPTEPMRIYEEQGIFYVEEKYQRWYVVQQNRRGDNGEFLYTESGRPDVLFRNDGDTFTDVTAETGITTERHWGNSSTWWDYNADGWPDLYVGNDFQSPDFLYRNNGDGTFTEVGEGMLRHSTWFSMGAVQSDFNNDGHIDFLLADMMPKTHYMQKASMASMGARLDDLEGIGGPIQLMRNTMHINTGTDRFLEGAWMSGVAQTEWTWAIRSADFDNDGLSDLFFCNGVPRQFNHSDLPPINHQTLVGKTHWDHYKGTDERREQNLAYRNQGNFQFEDVSKPWGLDHLGMSYGSSIGDLDGDGRLELLTTNLNDPLSVYRNERSQGNRIVIELRGTESNSRGIGSLVTATTADGVTQSRQLFPYGGFLDADEPVIHFGLGDHEKVDAVTVSWPSGHTQIFRDLEVNQRYTLTEPEGAAEKGPAIESREPENPWFTRSNALEGYSHAERYYDDFERQPLLPFQLSQLGPGQAWGDVDGDGDADLYLGGAAGQPGQLFLNRTQPNSGEIVLQPAPEPLFSVDAPHEDMGAVFFDADGDGDADLYVVSGGVECELGDDLLKDRLYLNAGDGDFDRSEAGALPDLKESGGVVAPADFDRDGDLDLFVGSRSIPGDYPVSPKSVLLQNDGGKFTSVAPERAPSLIEGGMVTSAIWSDVDNDGWLDLLTTNDYGPIRLFKNAEGTLEEASEAAGLVGEGIASNGWWTGIDGRDIDNDGDIDFVVANLGRNTQYKASSEFPEFIYYGDFDDSGKRHIVEARHLVEKGERILYPRRGFMNSSRAMPYIGDKMQTYHEYASQSLTGIYDSDKLEKALVFRNDQRDSVVLINDGSGRFEMMSLPHLAQVSPGFGIVLRDIDLDGLTDCYVVQNHFTAQEEIGEIAGGLSLLLRGTGNAEAPFEPVWSRDSGLEVPGDAKSLAAVDLNADGREDFVIGVNNADPEIFVNQTGSVNDARPIRIRLAGKDGNPSAIGARVTVRAGNGPAQTAEVVGGGSYLAQSSSDLIFGLPKEGASSVSVEVRWPDGSFSKHEVEPGAEINVIEP